MSTADPMRDRLRELGRARHPSLDAEMADRIAEHMRTQGPSVVRRSHQQRRLLRATAVAVPLIACGFWIGLNRDGAEREVAEAPRAAKPAAVAPHAESARVQECASQPVPEATFAPGRGGAQLLDLGARGRAVLEPGAQAVFETREPCKLAVRLAKGRVSVHAANLFGGELRVATPDADVVVHGTKFAVSREGDTLEVAVDEGAVGVERDGRAVAPLVTAGQGLSLRASQAPVIAALSDTSRAQLRAALAIDLADGALPSAEAARSSNADTSQRAARAAVAKPVASAKLVARADDLWRSGKREESRESYREAGSGKGATAEAAWLALARRELSIRNTAATREALASYEARFPNGELAVEAAGIAFRAALLDRDRAKAERIARTLIERYPDTPQSEAAARWRSEQGKRP